MKKQLLLLTVLAMVQFNLTAQKKSELIAKIDVLEKKLDSTEALLAKARRNEAASQTTAASLQSQLEGLQAANTTLLQNLNNFAEVSKRNTTNAQKALETMDKREAQIKTITDVFAQNDSLAVVVVGKAKNTLGDSPQLGIGERAIAITYPVSAFFDDYQQPQLNAMGKETITQLAAFFTAYPQYGILIEGLSNTGEFDITGKQAHIIASELQRAGVELSRLSSTGKDGGFKDGFVFRMQPRFDTFYSMVKDQLKAQ